METHQWGFSESQTTRCFCFSSKNNVGRNGTEGLILK